MLFRLLALVVSLARPLGAVPELQQAIATEILAPLFDPVKVATLKVVREDLWRVKTGGQWEHAGPGYSPAFHRLEVTE